MAAAHIPADRAAIPPGFSYAQKRCGTTGRPRPRCEIWGGRDIETSRPAHVVEYVDPLGGRLVVAIVETEAEARQIAHDWCPDGPEAA